MRRTRARGGGREAGSGRLVARLQDLQAAHGYLPAPALKALSAALGVPLSRVLKVARSSPSFRLEPRGRHEVSLCVGTVCGLKGAASLCDAICGEYGIQPGGTTADRLFTLNAVDCLGCCGLAPVMLVDGRYHGNLSPKQALRILRALARRRRGAGGRD